MFGMLQHMRLITIDLNLLPQEMFGTESNNIFIHKGTVNINELLLIQIHFFSFKYLMQLDLHHRIIHRRLQETIHRLQETIHHLQETIHRLPQTILHHLHRIILLLHLIILLLHLVILRHRIIHRHLHQIILHRTNHHHLETTLHRREVLVVLEQVHYLVCLVEVDKKRKKISFFLIIYLNNRQKNE